VIEKCPIDDGVLSAANRACIRNGLGEIFDSRFISVFSHYGPDRIEYTDLEVLTYDPAREIKDPLIRAHARGRYRRYAAATSHKAPEGTDFHPLKVPVGEYGENAAVALSVAGTQLVNHIAGTATRPLGVHEKMHINYHTYYGVTQKYGDESFLANQQQGVAFTIHALAALTAQRVKGFSTYPDLLRGVAERYTTETLTKLVGSLAVTPLVEEGCFVNRPLTPELHISPEMTEYAVATRKRHRKKARDARQRFAKLQYDVAHGEIDPDDVDWDEFRRLHQVGALGLSCPAADRGGSVTITVRSLSKIVEALM
jgi:hypothetical protein